MMNNEQYDFVINAYEEKLKSLMGEEEFDKYTTQVAKDLFLHKVGNMPDGLFKRFILDNLDEIFQENNDGQPIQ